MLKKLPPDKRAPFFKANRRLVRGRFTSQAHTQSLAQLHTLQVSRILSFSQPINKPINKTRFSDCPVDIATASETKHPGLSPARV
jgi:hypothetical protein